MKRHRIILLLVVALITGIIVISDTKAYAKR